MDPKPVTIGQPFTEFPGESFNALVAGHLAKKAEQTKSNDARGNTPRLVVSCNNSTSTTVEPGWIMGFSAPVFTTEAAPDGDPQQVYSAPMVKGITPAVPEHSSQFVVALDYIRGTSDVTAGAVGPACLMGLAWVKVNFTLHAHDHVIVAEGETQLQSSTSGITPVWIGTIPDDGDLPADVWALILIGGGTGGGGTVARGTCKATSMIDAASDSMGVRTATIADDSHYSHIDGDTFSNIENWSLVDITTDTYMIVIEIGGHNKIISAFC